METSEDIGYFGRGKATGNVARIGITPVLGLYDRSAYEGNWIKYPYDPNVAAACWRIVLKRFVRNPTYINLAELIIQYDAKVKARDKERHEQYAKRFALTLSVNDDPVTTAEDDLASCLNEWQIQSIKTRMNAFITKESKLWGVDRTTLARICLENILRENPGIGEFTIRVFTSWLRAGGVNIKPKLPNYRIYMPPKAFKKGTKGKKRMSRKSRR